ncbi:hypothetical protein IHE49_15440 [Rhodanobacter sp. 7MK24]|uniref:hypothetical protein n=1 Tax=Rhodanobacter sp. 7MK24 TaxID=2775922 RepID=UPI001782092C|nr:hypothetical protein [Rhodanobacter sp. 7MK24]MBD8881876.1 hypothetical protein [Rhodanobacter sp. 7MK24]
MQGHFVDSFIETGEYDLIAKIASSTYQGVGRLVDAGCFAGTSTRALCEGLSNVGARHKSARPIIVIDRFIAADEYICNHFLERGIDVRFGESFLPLFMDRLSPHLHLLEIRAGDLVQVGRIESAIEVLLVDIAKTQALNAYVVRKWFPRLIPDHSVVLHQDFYTPAQPWIAVSMGLLMDYFEIITPKVGESCCFKLKKAITKSSIDAALSVHSSSVDALASLDRMIEILGDAFNAPLLLMKALTMSFLGDRTKSHKILDELINLNPRPDDRKWNKWVGLAAVVIRPDLYTERSLIGEAYLRHVRARLGGYGIS